MNLEMKILPSEHNQDFLIYGGQDRVHAKGAIETRSLYFSGSIAASRRVVFTTYHDISPFL